MFNYKGLTLYHATHLSKLSEIAEHGLICDKSESKQKAIYLSDCPYAAANYSARDDEDWVLLELNIDNLDHYKLNSDDYELQDYLRACSDEDMVEYDSWKDVPWPLSLEKVSQVAYADNIRPHLITVTEYLGNKQHSDFKVGQVLNEKYAEKAWMEKGRVKKLTHGYIQNFTVTSESERIEFPQDIIELFTEMGHVQRQAPERIMVATQKFMSGNVLSYSIENVGDLYNRMTKDAKFGSLNPGLVIDKTQSCLERLNRNYDFKKQFTDSLKSTAEYYNFDYDEFKAKVDEMLLDYANAHRQLATYNKPQWLAREASIALGEQNFDRARGLLTALEEIANDPVKFVSQASKVMRSKKGDFIEYSDNDKSYDLTSSLNN